jgi:hypothetical protein
MRAYSRRRGSPPNINILFSTAPIAKLYCRSLAPRLRDELFFRSFQPPEYGRRSSVTKISICRMAIRGANLVKACSAERSAHSALPVGLTSTTLQFRRRHTVGQ